MIGVPLLFTSLQLVGSDVIILFSVAGPCSSASISLGMSSVWGEFCVVGCVGSVGGVGCVFGVFVTFGTPSALHGVSSLATFLAWASVVVGTLGVLSSGTWCLDVSLI